MNDKKDEALDRMAENARELGLDYEPIVEQVEDSVGMGQKAWDMVDPKELAKEFHKALADPPCKTGSQCTSKCQQCEQPAQQSHCNDCGGFDPECPLAQPTQGCEFCSHPLYAGTKCKNCGREQPARAAIRARGEAT